MKAQNQILMNIRKQEQLKEWTRWKQIAGKREAPMDAKYQKDIINRLIPMLHHYGIEMSLYPSKDAPGYQVYNGYINNKRIDFIFINSYQGTENDRLHKYDMTVKVCYDGEEEIAGVVSLRNRNYTNDAFSMITMCLENMGIIGNKQEKEKPEEEVNQELEDLAKFKQGLSEQEILEIDQE